MVRAMNTQRLSIDSVPYLEYQRARLSRYASQKCGPDVTSCQINALHEALAREEVLLREKNAMVLEQETLRRESDHRLLNGLQLVVSLLSLQSRTAPTPEAAAQLSIAANRVATIERIHRRLHNNDGARVVAFKKYLEEFCQDFSGITRSADDSEPAIRVEGKEILLPAATAIPLGFIVNELLTNAMKYGEGRVCVTLDAYPGGGHVVSVSNAGPPLPQGFDPAASKGLGMKIIRSFAQKIGGKLIFARDEDDQGAQFSVLFP